MTKLESAFLGADEGPMKDLITDLISKANDTYNGRFHLQHLTADEQPKGNYRLTGEDRISHLHLIGPISEKILATEAISH